MKEEERTEIEKHLKIDEVAVDTQTVKIGTDSEGYPVFEIRFEKPPVNYQLVRLIEPWNGAILKDLDYKDEEII